MYSKYHQAVSQFHRVFGHPCPKDPIDTNTYDKNKLTELKRLRIPLIKEEFIEFKQGYAENSRVKMIDGLTDLLYVVEGTFVSVGLNDNVDLFVLPEQKKIMTIDIKMAIESMEYMIDCCDRYFENLSMLKLCLQNIVYSIYFICYSLNFDLDKSFDIVHENNMSKLCYSEEDAIDTVNKYKSNGIDVAYRSSEDETYYVVYNIHSGKILKSIKWREPDLTGTY